MANSLNGATSASVECDDGQCDDTCLSYLHHCSTVFQRIGFANTGFSSIKKALDGFSVIKSIHSSNVTYDNSNTSNAGQSSSQIWFQGDAGATCDETCSVHSLGCDETLEGAQIDQEEISLLLNTLFGFSTQCFHVDDNLEISPSIYYIDDQSYGCYKGVSSSCSASRNGIHRLCKCTNSSAASTQSFVTSLTTIQDPYSACCSSSTPIECKLSDADFSHGCAYQDSTCSPSDPSCNTNNVLTCRKCGQWPLPPCPGNTLPCAGNHTVAKSIVHSNKSVEVSPVFCTKSVDIARSCMLDANLCETKRCMSDYQACAGIGIPGFYVANTTLLSQYWCTDVVSTHTVIPNYGCISTGTPGQYESYVCLNDMKSMVSCYYDGFDCWYLKSITSGGTQHVQKCQKLDCVGHGCSGDGKFVGTKRTTDCNFQSYSAMALGCSTEDGPMSTVYPFCHSSPFNEFLSQFATLQQEWCRRNSTLRMKRMSRSSTSVILITRTT